MNTDEDVVFLNAPNRKYLLGSPDAAVLGDVYAHVEHWLSDPANQLDAKMLFNQSLFLLLSVLGSGSAFIILIFVFFRPIEFILASPGFVDGVLRCVICGVPLLLLGGSFTVSLARELAMRLHLYRVRHSTVKVSWYLLGHGKLETGMVTAIKPDGTIIYSYQQETGWGLRENHRKFKSTSPVIVNPGDKVKVVHMRHDLSVLL